MSRSREPRAMASAALAACALATACTETIGQPDPVACSGQTLGDTTKPIDFDFLVADGDYQVVALNDGDPLPLLIPPQGGHVSYVGVRATNVGSCGLVITGALRDEASRQVRFDTRTVNLVPSGDGWGTTGPVGMPVSGAASNFANIPACPNSWASTDVDGHVFALEVTLTDPAGRTLEKTMHVTPTCQAGDLEDCECTCAIGYVLGSVCSAEDAGGDDASPASEAPPTDATPMVDAP